MLPSDEPTKEGPAAWLTLAGLEKHLRAEPLLPADLIPVSGRGSEPRTSLWSIETKLGIGLDTGTRTVKEGLLYTTEVVRLGDDVSFVVSVAGAGSLLPDAGLLRLGGDGRGASVASLPAVVPSTPPFRDPGCRFRLILSTPGLFPAGWTPTTNDGGRTETLRFDGFAARLVCAAVPRREVVSGWDLVENVPKPALRVVPAGAVYWFEVTKGDSAALSRLATEGLWPAWNGHGETEFPGRRQEGFNNVWVGTWKD